MAILLSYQKQLKFYDTILERMAEKDKGTLVFLTSDGWLTLSIKVMQIFSPLVMDVACKMASSVQETLFINLPEFKTSTVNQLLELLLRGQIMEFGTETIEDVKDIAIA